MTVERVAGLVRHAPAGARPRLLALLVPLVLLSTTFSGCLSVDFFLPQKDDPDETSDVQGVVRLWVAVQPGAIGSEFVHYNVTFGPTNHVHNIFGDQLVPMETKFPTHDLVRLEQQGKAGFIAGVAVPEGAYFGFTYQVLNASLGKATVVGNDNGKEVLDVEPIDIPEVTIPGNLMVDHGVFAGSVTDLYLEVDMRKSLQEEKGSFQHATKVVGVSVYINGHKAGRVDFTGRTAAAGRAPDPYGSSWLDASKYPPPRARFETEDPRTGEEIYDSTKFTKRHDAVIGLGQTLDFTSQSYSRIIEKGERADISVWDWNFGDGTGASGPTAAKNWTGGGMFDVSLTVRDEFSLVNRAMGTFVVPYRPDEAVTTQRDARAGTIHLGSGTVDGIDLSTASEHLEFPEDLENGDLYIGGYRVNLRYTDVTGGAAGAATLMRMNVKSGHLQESFNGTSPLSFETAGLPFWRGPLKPWVDETIDIELELTSGAEVSYELVVEALYYENATRGLDRHAAHRHGTWTILGVDYRGLHWDGTALPLPEEEE